MADSQATPNAAAEPGDEKPATFRLVIRAKIIPEETPPPAPPRSDRRMLGLVAGGIVALLVLGWIGVSVLRNDSPATRSADDENQGQELDLPPPVSAPNEDTHVATAEPVSPTAAAKAAAANSTATNSLESAATTRRDAPPSPLNEVMPAPSRNALQTIRGTIRVSVRVTIDQQGSVIAAMSAEPGPSRYFERLALEAARKWTFTPATTAEPRNMLVRFSFTREAVTARAESAHSPSPASG